MRTSLDQRLTPLLTSIRRFVSDLSAEWTPEDRAFGMEIGLNETILGRSEMRVGGKGILGRKGYIGCSLFFNWKL